MWMDDEDAHLDERDLKNLVKKFDSMLEESSNVYFDVDQLELIIEYYLERGLAEKALKAVNHGLELFSGNEFLLLRKGQISVSMGELETGKELLKKLEISDSKNPEILFGLGMIEAQQHDPNKAIFYYKKAFDTAENDFRVEILIELALQYQFLDELDKSLSCYSKALKLGFNSPTVLRELYALAERFQKMVEVADILDKYLLEEPYSHEAWFYLGNIKNNAKAYEKAIEAYDFSLAIKPEFTFSYFKKADALMRLERFKEAISVLEEELEYRDPVAFNYSVIADCYEQLEDYETAELFYKKALELDENYADAYLGLGFVKEINNESAKAQSYYKKAISLDEKNANGYLLLSNLYCNLDRHGEALNLIKAFLENDNRLEEVWIELSEIYARKENYTEALNSAEMGIENALSNEKLWLKKVLYLHKNGLKKNALELMRELLEEDESIKETLLKRDAELINDSAFLDLLNQY